MLPARKTPGPHLGSFPAHRGLARSQNISSSTSARQSCGLARSRTVAEFPERPGMGDPSPPEESKNAQPPTACALLALTTPAAGPTDCSLDMRPPPTPTRPPARSGQDSSAASRTPGSPASIPACPPPSSRRGVRSRHGQRHDRHPACRPGRRGRSPDTRGPSVTAAKRATASTAPRAAAPPAAGFARRVGQSWMAVSNAKRSLGTHRPGRRPAESVRAKVREQPT